MPANTVNYRESGVDISEKYISFNDTSLINPTFINPTGGDILGYGTLWSWGFNRNGDLGSGTILPRSSPVQVGALTNWKRIFGGQLASMAIKTDGSLWGWGVNNSGDLQGAAPGSVSSPIQIGSLTNWSTLAAGQQNYMALKTDGTLWTWGDNTFGEIGNGTASGALSSPVQLGSSADGYVTIGAGIYTDYAIKSNGTLWAWGYNQLGQLGDNTIVPKSSPIQIGALTNWKSINGGYYWAAAIKTNGTIWAWGDNTYGSLGDLNNAARSSPVQIGALNNWSSVAIFYYTAVATKTDKTLWAWGENGYGTVGNGTASLRVTSPVQIGALFNWKSSHGSNGSSTVATIKTDGTLWCWGYNGTGDIGDNTIIPKSSPIQIGALTTWKQAAVFNTTIAIK